MSSLPLPAREKPPTLRPQRWRLPLRSALGWPLAAALLLSLQFLTQAWVWDNWPVSDVLLAWLHLLGNRIAVAFSITLLIWAASGLPVASLRGRAVLLAVAVGLGALLGELGLRLLDDGAAHAEIGGVAIRWTVMALAFAGMFYLWRNAVELHERWQSVTLARLRGQQQLANAQLAALRHQIEPHFLFNTLATVRRLHRTEPAAGALMLANFIDYLRRAMPMLDSPQVPLARELALLRAYLAVIEVRMSGRLRTEIDVPDALLNVMLPPLVLATLVENAVKHGLAPLPAPGLLRISARASGRDLEVVVEDNGVGFGAVSSGGSGIGLANARARLRTLHGAAASLRLEAAERGGVRATLTLPATASSDR